MRNDRGYTYLITNGREYKIGMTTKTPLVRVEELQTGSPTKISISAYSYNSNALEMELYLHNKFSHKRLEGEWFALNDDDVAMIHHYFETNYLDEYFAPLSEKAIEIKKIKEIEELRVNSKLYADTSLEKDSYYILNNPDRLDKNEMNDYIQNSPSFDNLIKIASSKDIEWTKKAIEDNKTLLKLWEEDAKDDKRRKNNKK